MPLYRYRCTCGAIAKKILKPEQVDDTEVYCLDCKDELGNPKLMDRMATGPGTQVTETLDNGAMVKKVERLADAEQIFHERAHGKKGVV